jgi:RHS repeat-associated protein
MFRRDPILLILRYSVLNDVRQFYSRDALNRMSQRVVWSPARGNMSVEHYFYDTMSRLRQTYRDEDGRLDEFGFNASSQLTEARFGQVWNGSVWVNPTRAGSYNLDNAGNRTSATENGSFATYSSNLLNQYTQAGPNAVTNGSEHEIAAYQGVNYTYIGDRQLSQVSGGGNTYRLGYDALGRCVWRWLNGTVVYYVYDGAKPIYEYKADGSRAGWNLYGKGIDEILLRADYVARLEGQGYFFQQNRLGSVTHLTGFSGEPIEEYRYDAFGQPTTVEPIRGSFNNRFKFTGREWNDTFGIYEYRARAYHPGLGRFLQSDPIGFGGGDANLFRYCGGDPVNRSDPSGLSEEYPSGKPPPQKRKDGNDSNNNPNSPSGYWGTPAGQAELASMASTGPIDVHSTELPSGNRGTNSLDRTGAAPGEGHTGDGGGGFGLANDPNNAFRQLARYNNAHTAEIASRLRFANAMDRYAFGVSVVVALPVVIELLPSLPSLSTNTLATLTNTFQAASLSTTMYTSEIVVNTFEISEGVEPMAEIIEFTIGGF